MDFQTRENLLDCPAIKLNAGVRISITEKSTVGHGIRKVSLTCLARYSAFKLSKACSLAWLTVSISFLRDSYKKQTGNCAQEMFQYWTGK